MTSKKRTLINIGLASSLALSLGHGLAAAQDEATDADEARRFGTVTVTAQRREQNALDVPLSVSAFSGASFSARRS